MKIDVVRNAGTKHQNIFFNIRESCNILRKPSKEAVDSIMCWWQK